MDWLSKRFKDISVTRSSVSSEVMLPKHRDLQEQYQVCQRISESIFFWVGGVYWMKTSIIHYSSIFYQDYQDYVVIYSVIITGRQKSHLNTLWKCVIAHFNICANSCPWLWNCILNNNLVKYYIYYRIKNRRLLEY